MSDYVLCLHISRTRQEWLAHEQHRLLYPSRVIPFLSAYEDKCCNRAPSSDVIHNVCILFCMPLLRTRMAWNDRHRKLKALRSRGVMVFEESKTFDEVTVFHLWNKSNFTLTYSKEEYLCLLWRKYTQLAYTFKWDYLSYADGFEDRASIRTSLVQYCGAWYE